MILAMDSDCHGILNVGTGTAYSFNEVVDLINEERINEGIGSEIKPRYVDNPIKNYVSRTLADMSKTKEILGFEARYTIKRWNQKFDKIHARKLAMTNSSLEPSNGSVVTERGA